MFLLLSTCFAIIITYASGINKGSGDNVRSYLGTVGVATLMYGITKVLKELQEQADDIVEYTENMNEFNAYLSAADNACYSSFLLNSGNAFIFITAFVYFIYFSSTEY